MKRDSYDVNKAFLMFTGPNGTVSLVKEDRSLRGEGANARFHGRVVAAEFAGLSDTQRWGLVEEMLNKAEIDPTVVGHLQLLTEEEERQLRAKGEK